MSKRNERVVAASAAFTAAMTAGEWERCSAIVASAISASESAADISALLHAGDINELVFGDSLLDGALADAIALRASSLPAADGAEALGWLGTLSACGPASLFARSTARDVRNAFRGAGRRSHRSLSRVVERRRE